MNLLLLIIFIQIFIESFPISSSGHVRLAELLTTRFFSGAASVPNFFDHFLHGPTILVLMLVFWGDWWPLVKRLVISLEQNYSFDQIYKNSTIFKLFFKLLGYIFTTTTITLLFWILFCHPEFISGSEFKLEQMAWYQSDVALLFGFFVTMTLLFSLRFKKDEIPDQVRDDKKAPLCHPELVSGSNPCSQRLSNKLTFRKSIILGFVQGFSLLLPGLSRFASVYVATRWLNIPTRRAFQFTFLMQFALIVPAFFLGGYKLLKSANVHTFFNVQTALTILLATILAYFALRWMRKLAHRKKLWYVGFYMILPVTLLILLMQ